MTANRLAIQTSILALLRGDLTASYIADRFGVTEAQVLEWRDTFLVAGVLALDERLCGSRGGARKRAQSLACDGMGEPSTTPAPFLACDGMGEPSTTPAPFLGDEG